MNKKTMQVVSTAAVFALGVPLVASAALFQAGDTVDFRVGETLADDVYAAGGTVTSGGTVNGDLYAGGGTVLVSGAVQADAVLGGGTVTVTSTIGDDLRIGGGTVVVQGAVGDDVVIGGGQVQLAGSRIGGDVLIGGGSVHISVPVQGNVKVGGGDVFINGPVTGNVEIDADRLTLGSNATIFGSLTYTSPQEVTIEEGAEVKGQTTYTPRSERGETAGVALAALVSVAVIAKLLMQLIGAILIGLIFKRYSTHVVHMAYARPLLELGRGLVVIIVLPVVSVLLLVTILGIPLGILGFLAFAGLMVMSWFMAPVLLGSFVYGWLTKSEYTVSWKTILLGVVLYFLLGAVPVVGWLIQCALALVAIGVIAKLKWQVAKEWR